MNKQLIIPPLDLETPISEYFKRYSPKLDSYICLSPFFKWPDYLYINQFPNFWGKGSPEDPLKVALADEQMESLVKKGYTKNRSHCLTWKEVTSTLAFSDIKYLYDVIDKMHFHKDISDERFKKDCIKLYHYLFENNIYTPDDGLFPIVYKPLFIESFKLFNYQSLIATTYFGRLSESFLIDDLLYDPNVYKKMKEPFPISSYFTEDRTISYTSPIDGLFCILTAPKDYIEKILEKYNFEGFYADDSTTCRWGLED